MKKIKIFIDITMTILFIILMGYYITGNTVHEILGVITFILFILHHILNRNWIKNIFKGKYNFNRTFMTVTNLLLFVSMLGMMISGIMISSKVFAFLNIPTTMFARRLHMISTSWGFVLMSIHVGIHIGNLITKITQKMKNSTFEYVYYFILILLIGLGIYFFIKNGFWQDMFAINDFKFFNYSQSPIAFYIEYISIILAIVVITYSLLMLVKKLKIKQRRGK